MRTMLTLAKQFTAVGAFLFGAYAAWAESVPRFEDYPAKLISVRHNYSPNLLSKAAQGYRTRSQEVARRKPNFPGHYIVSTWGGGTDCERGVIVDAVTGKDVFLPGAWSMAA